MKKKCISIVLCIIFIYVSTMSIFGSDFGSSTVLFEGDNFNESEYFNNSDYIVEESIIDDGNDNFIDDDLITKEPIVDDSSLFEDVISNSDFEDIPVSNSNTLESSDIFISEDNIDNRDSESYVTFDVPSEVNYFSTNLFSNSADDIDMNLIWASGVNENGIQTFSYDTGVSTSIGPVISVSVAGYIPAGNFRIRVPRYLESGRIDDDNVKAEFNKSFLGSNWTASLSPDSNSYIVTNKGRLSGGQNYSLSLNYTFTLNKTQSDKVWTIDVELMDDNNSVIKTLTTKGRIRTSIQALFRYVIDSYTDPESTGISFVTSNDYRIKKLFGDVVLDPNYIYDIVTGTTLTSGTQEISYDKSYVLFTPGKYPKSTDKPASTGGYYRYDGWGGELVAASVIANNASSAHNSDKSSVIKIPMSSIKTVSNPDYYVPAVTNNTAWHWFKDVPRGSKWNTYKIPLTLLQERFSDQYNIHTWYLVRFKKDSSVTGGASGFYNSARISVNCQQSYYVIGKDNSCSVASDTRVCYRGTFDDVYYEGNIYATSAELTSGTYNMGLSTLLNGSDVTAVFSHDYYCANVNRTNYNESSAEPYKLDCIFDNLVLNVDGVNLHLKEDDYTIKSVSVEVTDNYGSFSRDSDGGYYPNWEKTDLLSGKEDDFSDVYYGTVHDSQNEWYKVPVSYKIYPDGYIQSVNLENVADSSITRVKVSYPYSQHMTRIRIVANVVIHGSSPRIRNLVKGVNENSLGVITGWNSLLGFTPNGSIDLKCSYSDVDTNLLTGKVIRDWQKQYPYSGYSSMVFPYSNFARGEMHYEKAYAVGVLAHALFDVSDTIVGGGSILESTVYSRRFKGDNIKTVTTMVDLGITDGRYRTSIEEDCTRDVQDWYDSIENKDDSPYGFSYQRYYIYLPEGADIDKSSITFIGSGIYNLKPKPPKVSYADVYNTSICGFEDLFKLQRPLSDSGQPILGNTSWGAITYKSIRNYEVIDINSRKLVIVDRVCDTGRRGFEVGRYYWSNSLYFVCMGCPVSFKYTMSGDDSFPTGLHDVLIATQLLNSKGEPYDLSAFSGNVYSCLNDAFPTANLDSYIDSFEGKTFIAITDHFSNRNNNVASHSQVYVNNNSKVDIMLGDEYSYSLKYTAFDNTTTNVVLFDSIENTLHDGTKSEWRGTISGVNLNNTGATLWVNANSIDIWAYKNGKADRSWLTAARGWTRVTNVNTYTGWDKVKSIAVDFGSKVFDSKNVNSCNAVVDIYMTSPKNTDLSGKINTYNELVFYDYHPTTRVGLTTIANNVMVTMDAGISGNDVLPETGGMGVNKLVLAGLITLYLGCIVIDTMKKRNNN